MEQTFLIFVRIYKELSILFMQFKDVEIKLKKILHCKFFEICLRTCCLLLFLFAVYIYLIRLCKRLSGVEGVWIQTEKGHKEKQILCINIII